MKKVFILSLILLLSTNIYSFGSKEKQIDAKEKVVVGLILEAPGIGDNSTNDSCYGGLQQAADEGLITLRVRTSNGLEDAVTIVSDLVKGKVNIIYAIGNNNKQLLIDQAKLYKDVTFIGIDIVFSDAELKNNLFGITFKEQDGGYLAGLLAGSLTYKYHKRHEFFNEINSVGIILGKNSPDIKRYELGFYAGVKKVNPACDIISININDLNNPGKGADAVKDLSSKGVDIIFTLAGESNLGVFKEAEKLNIFVIAANNDQSSLSEIVLTSVIKKMSISTYLLTKSYLSGEYESGSTTIYGLDDGAISLASYYKYDKYIPKDLRVLIKDMTKKLIKGSEKIPEDISMVVFDPLKVPVIEG